MLRTRLRNRAGNEPIPSPFSYEMESQSFFAQASSDGVEPNEQRKMTYNKAIKKLKEKGIWAKITHLYFLTAATSGISRINLKNPGINTLTVVGTPTFTADDGWVVTAGTVGSYLDSGYALSNIGRNNHCLGVYSLTATGYDAHDLGTNNTNSLSMVCRSAGTRIIIRSMSGSITIGTTNDTTGLGFYGFSRDSSSSININRFGYNFTTNSTASQDNSAISATMCILTTGPGSVSPGRKLSLAYWGSSLSETETKWLYAIFREYMESCQYGEFYQEEARIGTQNISADVIIYGATSSAVTAAYEAARQGKSVAICGGWRDRRIGGMSAGGLGSTDFDNHASLGGLPRWVLTKINSLYGRADTTFDFECVQFSRALKFLMDPTRNGGFTIPVYFSKGVLNVVKSGANITSFTTADGRKFTGSVFIDSSYEGDLAYKSGVTMTKGREAAGSGKESLNGFRGIITSAGGNNHQMKAGGTIVNIDPYIIPGNSSSGLLNGISRTYGTDTPTIGSADNQIQAYNFRLMVANYTYPRIPFPATPPSGYNAANYEPLGRLMAAYPGTAALSDMLLVNVLTGVATNDINSKGGWSTDYWGGATAYPAASYSQREAIWKETWNRILGLFYYLQYDSDSRITSTVRTSAQAYGFHADHYFDGIHENDDVFMTPQMYVREAWRMVGPLIWDGNDIAATDGTTPRSTKTIAAASYAMDSHSTEALADPNGGTPRIWLSGNFEDLLIGDQTAPIPYEVITPQSSDCTNLLVTFAISATHVAFGSIRMEFTSMQIGQSAGLAASLAIDGGLNVQSVDYTTLRSALLLSPSLSGEVSPVLPQIN